MLEGLVMREIPWSSPSEDGTDKPGKLTPYTTGRLDVFRRPFRLTIDGHDAQSIDVDTDRQHVGRQHDVDSTRIALLPLGNVPTFLGIPFGLEHHFELIEILGDVLVRNPRSQLADIHDAALGQTRPLHHAHLHTVRTSLHVVLGQTLHATQLSQRVEVAHHGHVRVGGFAESIEQRLSRGQRCRVDTDQHRRP
ncbi:hypothetical protein D3C78_1168870 [compost metagenome]